MLHSIPPSVTTLVFDLGGVIVDLAPERTFQAFADLSGRSVSEILKVYQTDSSMHAYETGKIKDEDFREAVRRLFNIRAADEAIDCAWNAMLLGIPVDRLKKLQALKKHFTTLALSNTNSIHLTYINEIVLKGESLDNYFHHAHYSHQIGMRKPDREIYEFVLKKHALLPAQTFFMDDNVDNITAAKAIGIETLLVKHPDQVMDLVKNYE